MIQPGVYFTLEAPFVRVLGLYSNVLEDPGVISGEKGSNTVLDNTQINFLTAALARVKSDKFTGAVIIAVHHPPFTGGSTHGGSPSMLADIDSACKKASILAACCAFWTRAQLSALHTNRQQFSDTFCGGRLRRPFAVIEHAYYLSNAVSDR